MALAHSCVQFHFHSRFVCETDSFKLHAQCSSRTSLSYTSRVALKKTFQTNILQRNRGEGNFPEASSFSQSVGYQSASGETNGGLKELKLTREKAGSNVNESELVSGLDSELLSNSTEVNSLQERFGSDLISFTATAGLIVAQLSVSNGSKAKLVINEARITSFKPRMWHQGFEEVLFATASDSELTETRLLGGVLPLLENNEKISYWPKWKVVDVSCGEQDWVQVVLEADSSPERLLSVEKYSITWQLTVVLTQDALGVILSAKNVGNEPCKFSSSIASHFAVNAADGSYLTGVRNASYIVGSREPIRRKIQKGWGSWLNSRRKGEIDGGDERDERGERGERGERRVSSNGSREGIAPAKDGEGARERGKSKGPEDFNAALCLLQNPLVTDWSDVVKVDQEDYSCLEGPLERLYEDAPLTVTMLDRGKRRAFDVDRRGFEDLVVNVLGERSKAGNWHKVVCLTSRTTREKRELLPGEEWEGGFLIRNRGAPDL